MERRTFIKQACAGCLGITGLLAVASLFEGCASLPVFKSTTRTEKLQVPLEKFAESNLVIVRTMWLNYDILLVKKPEGIYKAIYMKCSHQDQPLSASGTGLFCNSHGSAFDLDGNVTREPAVNPLTVFDTTADSQFVTIAIPKQP